MSHVDEGTLHAYLDGELPSTERAALEAHVAECATCRASLVDERALRERASAVLGAARPLERPAPPLDQLRRTPRRSLWHVRPSLAWAASIILALGIGYVLRNPSVDVATTPPAQPTTVATDRVAPAQSTPREERALDTRSTQARAQRQRRAAALAVKERGRVGQQAAEPSDVAATVPAAGSANSAAAPVPSRVNDSLVRERLKTMRLEAVVVTGAGAPAVASRDRPSTTGWTTISRTAARSLLGADPVGLPGLATRAIRRGPGPAGVVMVEQALDSTTVIQIIESAASANAFGDSSVRGGARAYERSDRLARFVGRLRVEITGPVSVDSLNHLLEQVRPLP